MKNKIKIFKARYKEMGKGTKFIYIILRILIMVSMIEQIIYKEYYNAFLCLLTLILFTLPTFVSEKFNLGIPSLLEGIIYSFIFASLILGEINNFYMKIPFWDTILHTLNGLVCAGIGISMIDILNKSSDTIKLSPIFIVFVGFCFSMTIGVLWKFLEYGLDQTVKSDMQKDKVVTEFASVEIKEDKSNPALLIKGIKSTTINLENGEKIEIDGGYLDIGINDTMKDLIVNFVGAAFLSVLSYIYIIKRDKYSFVEGFFITRKEKNI